MYKSKLQEMALTTPTQYWLDSCSQKELAFALENSAVGATTNPLIVQAVLENELASYDEKVKSFVKDMPEATEDDIAWKTIEYMAVQGAKTLEPIFDPLTGRGRISIQTNTKYHRNAKLIIEQGYYFSTLAPNMQVKVPCTSAGIKSVEELTYRGVSINATVSFTVPQAVAAAEAAERGLARRAAEGLDNSKITPVCTIMTGRLDDYIKDVASKKGIMIDPGYLELAGVAVVKSAYKIFKAKGYKAKVLGAAYRNRHHLAELIGGDMLHMIPYKFQVNYNNSDVKIENTIDKEIDPLALKTLLDNFEEYRRAYYPDGMTVNEFDNYGATLATLRGFYAGYDKLVLMIRKYIVG